jgi:hypothetical protein
MDWFTNPGNMLFDSYLKEYWKQANIAFKKVKIVEGEDVEGLNQQSRKVVNIKISTTSPKIALDGIKGTFIKSLL